MILPRILDNPLARRVTSLFADAGAANMFLCVMLMFVPTFALAQELTPRAYWPAPHGTKILITGYAYSKGDIVTNPSLPLVGVDSRISTGVVAYRQTVNLAGRTANVQIEIPYVDANTTGAYQGRPAERSVSGIADVSATLDVNLLGAPSMTAAEFQAFRQNPAPILAASIKVVAPTGEYEPDKLINVGTNRWATKLKLAYLQPMEGKWVLEMAAGVWFFEDNDEFLGTTLEQEPIGAFDLSIVKRFQPGFWGSIDATYYVGGRTIVGGNRSTDLQRNARLGMSLGYPIKGRHAIKVSINSGVVTESGGDYDTLILNYLYRIQ